MVSVASRAVSCRKSWLSRMSFSRALPVLTWAFLSCASMLGKLGGVAGVPAGAPARAFSAPARQRITGRVKVFFTYVPFLETFQFVDRKAAELLNIGAMQKGRVLSGFGRFVDPMRSKAWVRS